jgi:hypothetical protein
MVAELKPSSSSLLVTFGGIAHRLAMPPFEFFRLASALEVSKVFLRDLDESWNHRGVRGLSTDVESTAEALERIVSETAAERVVFTGNSAGGYASLLFGALSPTRSPRTRSRPRRSWAAGRASSPSIAGGAHRCARSSGWMRARRRWIYAGSWPGPTVGRPSISTTEPRTGSTGSMPRGCEAFPESRFIPSRAGGTM